MRLIKILPRLNRLCKITYEAEAPVPWILLRYLNKDRSDCRLHVTIPFLSNKVQTVSRLQNSPYLFALDVHTSRGNTPEKISDVVSTCPNLKHFSMNASGRWTGDPELHILRVAMESPRSLYSLRLQGFYHIRKNVKHFNDKDWSSLTSLSFYGLSFIPDLAPQLVNLRSLQVDLGGATFDPEIMRDPSLNQFLFECRPLSELKLICYTETFDLGVLEHHGRTLRVLSLREDHRNLSIALYEDTDRWDYGPRTILSSQTIQTIGESCPNLLTLGMNLLQQEDGNERIWVYIYNFYGHGAFLALIHLVTAIRDF